MPPTENPAEHEDWECRYILSLPDQTIDRTMFGIDSLQAMLIAMKTAKTLLTNYVNSNKLKITWLGMDDLGLGMIH